MGSHRRFIPLCVLSVLVWFIVSGTLVHASCGSPYDVDFTPRDYRDPAIRPHRLALVENFHFTADVENLSASRNTRSLATDISYTLRRFPNHHRALDAMSRLSVREATAQPEGSRYTVDCWFQRAVIFQVRDGVARMLYGVHLSRLGKHQEALEHMNAGLNLHPGNPMIQYHTGLVYLEMEDYEKAREYAQQAYGAGYTAVELRSRLEHAGQWESPESAGD